MENNQSNGKRYDCAEKLFSLILTFAMLFNMFGGIIPAAFAEDVQSVEQVINSGSQAELPEDKASEQALPIENEPVETGDEKENNLDDKPEIQGLLAGKAEATLKIGDDKPAEYETLEEAFADAVKAATTESSPAEIALLADCTIESQLNVPVGSFISLDMNSCVISFAGKSGYTISIEGVKTDKNTVIDCCLGGLTIDDGSAEKTVRYWVTAKSGEWTMYGDGLTDPTKEKGNEGWVEGKDYFTTVGGVITGSTTHDNTIYNYGGKLVLRTVSIVGNKATKSGGGVLNVSGAFIADGCVIAGNTTDIYGAGVFHTFGGYSPVADKMDLIIGGTTKIYNNVLSADGVTQQNVGYFYENATFIPLSVGDGTNGASAPAKGMNVGITIWSTKLKDASVGIITDNGTADYIDYFHSDSKNFIVDFTVDHLELVGNVLCTNTKGDKEYSSIAEAMEKGETEIKLVRSGSENVVIKNKQSLTLDLNGFVLTAPVIKSSPIISINAGGSLTINDNRGKSPVAAVADKDGDGVYETFINEINGNNSEAFNEVKKSGCKYYVSNFSGAIFGGKNGGITNCGTLVINGGIIAGNTKSDFGGGVNNYGSAASFTLTDGLIAGNSSGKGGGICNSNGASAVISGGEITGNTASVTYGGGIYNDAGSSLSVVGALISTNKAVKNGGGIYTLCSITVGGDASVNGSSLADGKTVNNIALPSGCYLVLSDKYPFDAMSLYLCVTQIDSKGSFTTGTVMENVTKDGNALLGCIYSDKSADGYVSYYSSYSSLIRIVLKGSCSWLVGSPDPKKGEPFYTFDEAAAVAVKSGAAIYLTANHTETITVQKGQKLTLDLYGNVLTTENVQRAAVNVEEDGNITIIDSIEKKPVHLFYDSDNDGSYESFTDDEKTFKDIQNGYKRFYFVEGGAITGHHGGGFGGGIRNYGEVTLSGGTVIGNSVEYGGGVANLGKAKTNIFTMTGGAVIGNLAIVHGGGILSSDNAVTKLAGGMVTLNHAGKYAGGVMSNGKELYVGGSIRVSGNTSNSIDNPVADNINVSYSHEISFGSFVDEKNPGNGVAVPTKEMLIGVNYLSKDGNGVVTVKDKSLADYAKLIFADNSKEKQIDTTNDNCFEIVDMGGYYYFENPEKAERFFSLAELINDINGGKIPADKKNPLNIQMTSDCISTEKGLIIGIEDKPEANEKIYLNIDMNGRKLYSDKQDGAVLTVYANVTIDNANTKQRSSIVGGSIDAIHIEQGGSLTLGGDIDVTSHNTAILNKGTLDLTDADGTVISGYEAVSSSGTTDIGDGVTLKGVFDANYQKPDPSSLVVTGGTTNVTGGSFEQACSGDLKQLSSYAAIVNQGGVLNVSGGSFNATSSKKNYLIRNTGGTTNVTGGYFTISVDNGGATVRKEAGTVNLYGGYYNLSDSYLAADTATGYTVLDSSKTNADKGFKYKIGVMAVKVDKSCFSGAVTDKVFETVGEALSHAPNTAPDNENGFTIQLVKNINETVIVKENTNVVIDLNNCILGIDEESPAAVFVNAGGSLQIIDTSKRDNKTYIVYNSDTDSWDVKDNTFDTAALDGLTENKDYVVVKGGLVLASGQMLDADGKPADSSRMAVVNNGTFELNNATVVAISQNTDNGNAMAIYGKDSKQTYTTANSAVIALSSAGRQAIAFYTTNKASVSNSTLTAIDRSKTTDFGTSAIGVCGTNTGSVLLTISLTDINAYSAVASSNGVMISGSGFTCTLGKGSNVKAETGNNQKAAYALYAAQSGKIQVSNGKYVGLLKEHSNGSITLTGGYYEYDVYDFALNCDKPGNTDVRKTGYGTAYYKDEPVYKYQVLPKGINPAIGKDIVLTDDNKVVVSDGFTSTDEETDVTLTNGDVPATEYTVFRNQTDTTAPSDDVVFTVMDAPEGVCTSIIKTSDKLTSMEEYVTVGLNTDMEYSVNGGTSWIPVAANGDAKIDGYKNMIVRYKGNGTDLASKTAVVRYVFTDNENADITPEQKQQIYKLIKETLAQLDREKTFNGDEGVEADENIRERLGDDGYIRIELLKTDTVILKDEAGTATAIEFIFDVTPIDENGDEVHSIPNGVRFRLPVTVEQKYLYADLYHEGRFYGQTEIKTDEQTGEKYIEVTGYQFSQYSYKLTNTKYVPYNPNTSATAQNSGMVFADGFKAPADTNPTTIVLVTAAAFATILAVAFALRRKVRQ